METNHNQPVQFGQAVNFAPPQAPTQPQSQPEAPKDDAAWQKEIEAQKQEMAPAQPPAAEPQPPAQPEPQPAPAAPVQEAPAPEPAKDQEDPIKTFLNPDVGNVRVEGNPPHEPTEEEKTRAARVKPETDHDVSRVVSIPLGSDTDVRDAFEHIMEVLAPYQEQLKTAEGRKELIENDQTVKDILTWMQELKTTTESSLSTDQAKLLLGMVDAVQRHGGKLVPTNPGATIAKIEDSVVSKSSGPQVLTGRDAITFLNSRYRGIYKVYLHNSGFHIRLLPMTNAELDAWRHEVDYEKDQLGRIIGGHFHLGYDIFIKKKLMELVRLCTVESNLQGWDVGNTLEENISVHDYDTLCWAFCTMMHPQGILFTTVCTNPNCQRTSPEQYMDLARMSYINPDVYNEQALSVVMKGEPTTPALLKTYRETILKTVQKVPLKGNDYLVLQAPTMSRYLKVGTDLLAKLASKVKDGNLSVDSEEVERFSVFHLSKMLSPWIKSVVMVDDPGKDPKVIDNPEAIQEVLPTWMEIDDKLMDKIEEFITRTKVSYYLKVNLRCPHCGRQLDLTKDNLYPVDMQELLFLLSYWKMAPVD